METTQVERRRMVTLSQEDFESMLERAAERGALHALHEVGLDGEDAARDIRALRNLLDAWREARVTAWRTVVKAVTTGLLLALVTGAAIKLKLFGGGQ
jgi:hypothetical protein